MQKGQQLLLRVVFGQMGCLDLVDQTALAVRALVPFVHAVQQRIALVQHQHWTLGTAFQLGSGDDDGDLDDAVDLGVQAGHLAVKPDQVLV